MPLQALSHCCAYCSPLSADPTAAGKPGEAVQDAGQHQRHVPDVLQAQQAA